MDGGGSIEGSGSGVSVGSGSTGVAVGDPVAVYGPWGCGRCRRCRTGMENYCENAAAIGPAGGGLGLDGGIAEVAQHVADQHADGRLIVDH